MSSSETAVTLDKHLNHAIHSVSASLRTLGPLSSTSSRQSVPALPDGLADILVALLQTVRHTTTSLALSFKPPITVPAAIQQLDKIANEYARMTSCVVGAAFHGTYSVLVDEWREGVESIGNEINRLIAVLKEGTRGSAKSSGGSGMDDNPYLAHTGMVWGAIDNMRNISRTENQAVIKKWEGQKEIVKDAWTEFKDFLEEQEEEDSEDEDEDVDSGLDGADDDEDDEWGDLEKAMAGGKMSPEERSRAEAAKPLLGLHQLLHASIPRFFPSLAVGSGSEPSYGNLLDASSDTVAAFDNAISTMYPEQDESEITTALRDLASKSRQTVQIVESRLKLGGMDESQSSARDQLSTFLAKWTDRLDSETKNWDERRLSLGALTKALP